MERERLRRLFPEHLLHLGAAPPDLPGAPEELYARPERHWFGVADRGRGPDLLRAYRIEIVAAARRGIPIVLALQDHEDALHAEAWLAAVRPDWPLRRSLELLDAHEARGMIPGLAKLSPRPAEPPPA